jgi:AraC-type DNA-binding domain-containing proteins
VTYFGKETSINIPALLVPEMALLNRLPKHRRKRFEQALHLMYESFEEHMSWEQIATHCSISPYHFHRQFTEFFNETPGQYMNRLRLQIAVNLLMSDTSINITNVAQKCGFSSSQALGKALKRELGVTAKHIQGMGKNSTPKETTTFLNQLAHPGRNTSLEQELAQFMTTELIWYPPRGVKKVWLSNTDWDAIFATYGARSTRLLGATPIDQLENSWSEIHTTIGDWQSDVQEYDFFIPEGLYFCSDVYITGDVGYLTALEHLFNLAEKKKLKINAHAFFVEMVRSIELSQTGGVTFSFQIPIVS